MAGEVIKISEHFWRIEENGVRMFLLEGQDRAMLVDTGFGTLPLKQILPELTSLPVFVVNTHTDGDHTGGNLDFDAIYMHPAEMDYYVNHNKKTNPENNIHPLWEGDVIDLGRWKFEVILTPGHTPGSIMLLEREKRMLISGDTIQDGNIFLFGGGRNLPAFRASLEKLKKLSGSFDYIWPSHGTCPVTKDIIPELIKGAGDLAVGYLEPKTPPWEMPCLLYRCEAAGFCYDGFMEKIKETENEKV